MTILSIDIGTTNLKGIVVKESQILESINIPVETIAKGLSQRQNPYDILRTVEELIEKAKAKYKLADIIITTAMHTLILLDEEKKPVSNMYLWSDSSLSRSVDDLPLTKSEIYKRTGTPVHIMSPMMKLFSIERSSYTYISDLKSFLVFNLCGKFSTDESNASASGLYNIYTKTWDEAIMDCLNLNLENFPSIQPIDSVHRLLKDPKIQLYMGSSDGVMANKGLNREPGHLVLSIGTSVGLRYLSDTIELSKDNNTFCYNAGHSQWLIGNASNNGGNLLGWLMDSYPDEDLSFDTIINILNQPLTDLIASPYVFGERGPFWIDDLKHSYLNLKDNHTMIDKVQAIIYSMFSNIELLLESLPGEINSEEIMLTGGFFNDDRMIQILSNFLERKLIKVHNENSVCFGGVGIINNSTFFESSTKFYPTKLGKQSSYKTKTKNYLRSYQK